MTEEVEVQKSTSEGPVFRGSITITPSLPDPIKNPGCDFACEITMDDVAISGEALAHIITALSNSFLRHLTDPLERRSTAILIVARLHANLLDFEAADRSITRMRDTVPQ